MAFLVSSGLVPYYLILLFSFFFPFLLLGKYWARTVWQLVLLIVFLALSLTLFFPQYTASAHVFAPFALLTVFSIYVLNRKDVKEFYKSKSIPQKRPTIVTAYICITIGFSIIYLFLRTYKLNIPMPAHSGEVGRLFRMIPATDSG